VGSAERAGFFRLHAWRGKGGTADTKREWVRATPDEKEGMKFGDTNSVIQQEGANPEHEEEPRTTRALEKATLLSKQAFHT